MRDDYTVHEEVYKGCTIKIEIDDNPSSPKNWGNLGTLVTWHDRYVFDEDGKQEHSSTWAFIETLAGISLRDMEELRNGVDWWYRPNGRGKWMEEPEARQYILKKAEENSVRIAVGMGDHSGIWLYEGHRAAATDPGGWDSGGIGWLYVRKDKLLEEYNYDKKFKVKMITPKVREYTLMRLRAELQTWDDYVRNNVYGYVIEEDNEIMDRCFGFYPPHDDSKRYEPDYTDCLEAARSVVDSEVEDEKKKHFEQLKTWIRARVPYYARKGIQKYG